jgi:hypothetical protein
MKAKPTITVAGNGNLQVHIPMIIRRMRGRKQVIAPQALDGEISGSCRTGPGGGRPGAGPFQKNGANSASYSDLS